MKNEFLIAITQLSAEKNLRRDVVLGAVEAALVSAFKKDSEIVGQDFYVKINPNTGDVKVFSKKNVVEKVEDARSDISLDEAKGFNAKAVIGDVIDIETTPRNAGRIAAQTAKQVVMQRLREAEREVVFEEYSDKSGDIVSGIVQRVEPRQIILDVGKTEAVLPAPEQVKAEHYRIGQRLKVYVLEVFRANKGPQVVVSRTHKNLLRRLFELEVPEIFNGTVELKAIAREPGYRSKVAVAARQEGVDPVGSCVGIRGIRIQNIINELNGEKIDVIQWSADTRTFIANALSPSQALNVEIREEEKTATVVVPDKQLSLAIGKEGQNARLAAKLTGWRIDIRSASAAQAEAERIVQAAAEQAALEPVAVFEEEPEIAAITSDVSTGITETVEAAIKEAAALTEVIDVTEDATEGDVVQEALPVGQIESDIAEAIERAEGESVEADKPQDLLTGELLPPTASSAPVVERPRLRFAEDIFTAAPAAKVGTKEKKGKNKRKGDEEPAGNKFAKAKKGGGGGRRPFIEEDELDDLSGYKGI